MSKHRAEVRPRYGRLATLGASLAVTVIACLGGAGMLPSSADGGRGDRAAAGPSSAQTGERATDTSGQTGAGFDSGSGAASRPEVVTKRRERLAQKSDPPDRAAEDRALPGDSGQGKRVVFSESRQRVWLVNERSAVVRTYLVSGSVYDNLEPGTFEVYSRSEDAVGIDDSGTMKYFVRFTQGDAGAAIGFHDIPVDDGELVQTEAQLGTPLSHGCIRQLRSDAVALWSFAPLGTTVVVTA